MRYYSKTNVMICSIHQPQFLPWLGYLNKISTSDIFVFLDDVQFKKNEYQNRNKIKCGGEARWLTAPVSFKFGDTLLETKVVHDSKWQKKMCMTIGQYYKKTPYFEEYSPALFNIINREWDNIAEFNQATVEWLMKSFCIETKTLVCSKLPSFDTDPTQRLIDICRHTNADTYLSGAGGREYLDVAKFEAAGIELIFQEFLHPKYKQCYTQGESEFVSHLSAIDMLFNCGSKNTNLLKGTIK